MNRPRHRPRLFSLDNFVQFAGLLIAIFAVAMVYSQVIRPRADEADLQNRVLSEQQEDFVPQRNIYIILRDYEQQICFSLLLWAMFMIAFKLYQVSREKEPLGQLWFDIEEGERIIPEEALLHTKQLEARVNERAGYDRLLLPKVLRTALQRFHATSSLQDVSQSVNELADSEAGRLESDLSLIRYIAWAIPSVGFIGTVRGIGEALAQANRAIQGDIEGVTTSLGLAFNSTLIALFLSIILMFFVHLLQSRQESLILEVEEYCRDNLLGVMKIPLKPTEEMPL